MSRHSEVCPGLDNCSYCRARIDDAEFPDPGADSDWQVGQDRWEAEFDRRGGSL